MSSITKGFFGALANDHVDFDLRWGEVHALLGENGAGKSTLCSVLAGLYRPDGGEVRIDGEVVELRSPHTALDYGVGMVYQHFRLVDRFTVAENLALGHPEARFISSRRELEQKVTELGERYNMPVAPDAGVWQLSVGEEQRVEILRLLYRGVKILILDEPTAVLTPQEARGLFETIRSMADEGRAIIFVSHKLDEVMEVSDRITVLRDGKNVGTVAVDDADPAMLARMMVGRDLAMPARKDAVPGEPVLSVTGLTADGDRGFEAVQDVDLEVRTGQIVGVAGVSGNGQRELAEALTGLRPVKAGQVFLGGVDITHLSVRNRIKLGLGFVPEDRLGTGLARGLPLAMNLSLKSYRVPPVATGPAVSRRAIDQRANELVDSFDIRGARPGLPVSLLSGGNLQRAILAREISERPKALVAAAPTRGLDVAATEAVRKLLLEERDKGSAILMISEDLEEILALSDEIVVIYEGSVIGRLMPHEADPETIGMMMAGREVELP
ncbi:MAG: ABC transporter ATP-binding protein [Acidimicrobiia bacterium]|nr:ABC transporter ATP-binding protein [Acidimicrobiia bacterium]